MQGCRGRREMLEQNGVEVRERSLLIPVIQVWLEGLYFQKYLFK